LIFSDVKWKFNPGTQTAVVQFEKRNSSQLTGD